MRYSASYNNTKDFPGIIGPILDQHPDQLESQVGLSAASAIAPDLSRITPAHHGGYFHTRSAHHVRMRISNADA
jgi:hypothetical protein